jgi:hypothetical protein
MIISDLSYSTVVDANVIGGTYKKYYPPVAKAYADAYSVAVGYITYSDTYTSTKAVAGYFSSSKSSSVAIAVGY